jgi:hypothetical protein
MGFQLVRKRINPDNPEVAGEHMDYELLSGYELNSTLLVRLRAFILVIKTK